MKRHTEKKIGGFILGFTLLFGVGLCPMATSHARTHVLSTQDRRNWDSYPNWGGSFDLRQTALNAGYNEGSKEGRNDRANGRHSNFQEFSTYQKATKDYSTRLGDRELYRRYFREAFQRGYNAEWQTTSNSTYYYQRSPPDVLIRSRSAGCQYLTLRPHNLLTSATA